MADLGPNHPGPELIGTSQSKTLFPGMRVPKRGSTANVITFAAVILFIVTLSADHRVKQAFCQHIWELAPHMKENSIGEPVLAVLEEIRGTRAIRDVPWSDIEAVKATGRMDPIFEWLSGMFVLYTQAREHPLCSHDQATHHAASPSFIGAVALWALQLLGITRLMDRLQRAQAKKANKDILFATYVGIIVYEIVLTKGDDACATLLKAIEEYKAARNGMRDDSPRQRAAEAMVRRTLDGTGKNFKHVIIVGEHVLVTLHASVVNGAATAITGHGSVLLITGYG
jgi:hypothetical protein